PSSISAQGLAPARAGSDKNASAAATADIPKKLEITRVFNFASSNRVSFLPGLAPCHSRQTTA
ncbi:MAG: hypothetical protein ACXW3V_07395, partial [Methylocystis sp.]